MVWKLPMRTRWQALRPAPYDLPPTQYALIPLSLNPCASWAPDCCEDRATTRTADPLIRRACAMAVNGQKHTKSAASAIQIRGDVAFTFSVRISLKLIYPKRMSSYLTTSVRADQYFF